MFTGIVYDIGIVAAAEPLPEGGARMTFEAPAVAGRTQQGSSVCVSGVCLTARAITSSGFSVDVMPQTLRLTTAGEWKPGTRVNLETSLRAGDELGGHFVYGHVDGVARILDVFHEGNARILSLEPPPLLARFLASQGSVTLDGVSLTIAAVSEGAFSVSLIPETLRLTTLQDCVVGDRLNIEADMMMKYIDQLLAARDSK